MLGIKIQSVGVIKMKTLATEILEDIKSFIPKREVLVTFREEDKIYIGITTDPINEAHDFSPLRESFIGKKYNGKDANLTIILDDIDDYLNDPEETVVICSRISTFGYAIISFKQIIGALFQGNR